MDYLYILCFQNTSQDLKKKLKIRKVNKLILNRGKKLYLSAPSHTTIESPEWYTFPLVYNILQVFGGSPQGHLTDRFCRLSSVLKNNVFVIIIEKKKQNIV